MNDYTVHYEGYFINVNHYKSNKPLHLTDEVIQKHIIIVNSKYDIYSKIKINHNILKLKNERLKIFCNNYGFIIMNHNYAVLSKYGDLSTIDNSILSTLFHIYDENNDWILKFKLWLVYTIRDPQIREVTIRKIIKFITPYLE